ncbi:MAG: dicarboxylate/amino acid:cation symporter [Sediminispirochaetaceae bacterium]
MKLWIKYVFAAIVGVLLGFYVFPAGEGTYQNLQFAARIVLNVGQYALFPLVFFSMTYAAFQLRMDQRVLAVLGKSLIYVLATGVLLVGIGTISVFLLNPERIPIIIETEQVYSLPGFREMLTDILPDNLFHIFIRSGNFLLPLVLFSLFLGLNFSFDKFLSKPAVQLFDSLSRIFYHIGKFVNEILGIGIIVLTSFFIVHLRMSEELELYSQLILLIGLLSAFIILGIYPAILYFLTGRQNPYRYLYALIAPAVAAFFSGNSYFSLIPLTSHVKENLGVPRKIGAVSVPLFTVLSKAGTAMVTSITFIVILKSYSSLGIGVGEVAWIMLFSFGLSLLTSSVPGLGVAAALTALCGAYGKGLETGFLIIYPILPVLSSFAVFLDVVTSGLGSLVISYSEENQKDIYAKDFI